MSCRQASQCPSLNKSVDHLKATSDLSQRLNDDIENIAFDDYRDALEYSDDTIDIHKRKIARHLYEFELLANRLSYQLKIATFAYSNSAPLKRQDSVSYEYMLSKNAKPFQKILVMDTTIRNKFMRLQAIQEIVLKIKQDIIKTQTGKGRIICRDIGNKLSLTQLNSVTDYWDILYLIENSHYTISKDILCTFSNLSCYKTKIRWRFWIRYSGNPDEALRLTRELELQKE